MSCSPMKVCDVCALHELTGSTVAQCMGHYISVGNIDVGFYSDCMTNFFNDYVGIPRNDYLGYLLDPFVVLTMQASIC